MKCPPNNLLLKPPKLSALCPNPDSFPEEFEKYLSNVMPEFPNIPRDAFEEWIFPFGRDHILRLYGKLDFKNINFSLKEWSISKCLTIQWWSHFNGVESTENGWPIEE